MNRVPMHAGSEFETCFREVTLRNRHWELAVLPELGCYWRQLRISAKGQRLDLLLPQEEHPVAEAVGDESRDELDSYWQRGSYILGPWSNRIADARFEFDGATHEMRANFPDGTAIHGDVRGRPWRVTQEQDDFVEATLDSSDFDDFNFPFDVFFRHRLRLIGERLRVELDVENRDTRRAPVGLGFHPYFRRRLTPLDEDVLVRVPAKKVYPLERCLPVAPAIDAAGELDLRTLVPLGDRQLDDCFTELEDNIVRLVYPGTRVEVRFEIDPVFSHVVVYSPRKSNGEASDFVAIEPVSNVNNGFNLMARGWPQTGTKVLEPGETWGGAWDLSVGDV